MFYHVSRFNSQFHTILTATYSTAMIRPLRRTNIHKNLIICVYKQNLYNNKKKENNRIFNVYFSEQYFYKYLILLFKKLRNEKK